MLKKKEEDVVDWEYEEDNGSLIGWLIVEAASKGNKYFDEIVKEGAWDSHKVNVELIINGVKVPATSTLNSIDEQLDKMVNEKAKEILKEKVVRLIDDLDQIEERIDNINLINLGIGRKKKKRRRNK